MPSNWIKTLERIRKTIKMTDDEAILMAITYLRGKAARWLEANEDNIINWDQFKKQYMSSKSNNDELWDTLENYHQSERQSVDDLILALSELFTKLEITDEQLHIRRFLIALQPPLLPMKWNPKDHSKPCKLPATLQDVLSAPHFRYFMSPSPHQL
ncbi:unnamed protein product [Absidia cylindrospora]